MVFAPQAQLYCLVLKHNITETVQVGSYGEVTWREGWLYYVGRAKRGWTSRAKRLIDRDRSPHWHIDYFQTRETASLTRIYPYFLDPDQECELAGVFRDSTSLELLAEGLGASDCDSGCSGHVLVGTQGPDVLEEGLEERYRPEGAVIYNSSRSRWKPLRN